MCFWGWGVKPSVSRAGFHEGILVSPSRAAVNCGRMRPFLSAVLTSAAPYPNPSPSIPLSPSHLHLWDFAPSPSIRFALSHPLLPAASFLPCSCLPHPCLWFPCCFCACVSTHESSCLSSAGPPASGPCCSGIALGSPAPALTVHTFPALRWCSLPGALSINKDFCVCKLQLAAANRPK